MPLSPQELQELQELEELESLEKQFAGRASAVVPQPKEVSTVGGSPQAALEGFGQTATLGYLPHIQAGVEKGVDKVGEALGFGPSSVDAKLREEGFNVPEESYVQARDQNIKRQANQAEVNPKANLAGKVAGIAASTAIPMGSASTLPKAVLSGGVSGAAYNPGDTEGELDPIQVQDRALQGLGGAAIGGLAKAGGSLIKSAATKQKNINDVKDSANLSKNVKSEIDDALQGLTDKQIKPRAEALREFLTGKKVEINPDRLKGISKGLDNYAETLANKADDTGRVQVDANRAQRLKKLLDNRAGYKQSTAFDSSAVAKQDQAKKAADIVRSKIGGLDPEVDRLNSEMGEAIKYRNALAKKAKSSPISSITTKPGTDKGSIVDYVDKYGGSQLEKRGQGIEEARDLLLNPINIFKPLEAPNELRKMGYRAGIKAGDVANEVTDKLPDDSALMLYRALLEGKR